MWKSILCIPGFLTEQNTCTRGVFLVGETIQLEGGNLSSVENEEGNGIMSLNLFPKSRESRHSWNALRYTLVYGGEGAEMSSPA